MSNARHIKTIRGQLRQLVQELLPSVLGTELYARLQKEQSSQLEVVAAEVKATLDRIEKSAKEHQNFVVREMLKNLQTRPVEQPPEAAPPANE